MGQIFQVINAAGIFDSHFFGATDFVIIAPAELSLHVASHTADSRGRQDSFGRAAGSHQKVDAAVWLRCSDGRSDVTIADQSNPCARFAHFCNQLVVAIALQNHDRQIRHRAALGFGHGMQVPRRSLGDVNRATRPRTDDQLVHVRIGRVQKLTIICNRNDRNRVRLAGCTEVGSFQRIDGNVHARGVMVLMLPATSDSLTNVEHRCFIALAFADHYGSFDLDRVKGAAHRINSGLICGFPITASHHPCRRERCCFGDSDHL